MVLLYRISIRNTSLVKIPEVNEEIRRLYGESIIKERGYNSTSRTAAAAADVGNTVSKRVTRTLLTGTAIETINELGYGNNFKVYAEGVKTHPDMQPPEKGVTLSKISKGLGTIGAGFAASGLRKD
jgi:hypothetical protein